MPNKNNRTKAPSSSLPYIRNRKLLELPLTSDNDIQIGNPPNAGTISEKAVPTTYGFQLKKKGRRRRRAPVTGDIETNIESAQNSNNENQIRKKIHLSIPENSLIAGEISFILNHDCPIECGTDIEIYLVINVAEPMHTGPTFSIESSQGNNTTTAECVTNLTESAFGDLLSNTYTWVIEDLRGFQNKLVNIKITFPVQKAPILNARDVAEFFSQKCFNTYDGNPGKVFDSIEIFFKEMHVHQKRNACMFDVNINVQHEKLKATLCPYQAKAVRWMLRRESIKLQPQNLDWKPSVMQILYSADDNRSTYYNIYTESILRVVQFPPFPRGGILADEMGLGKTVAVIALILNNPRNKNNDLDSGDFLVATPGENVKVSSSKLINETSKCLEKERNMEGNLSPSEELVACSARKGGAMKRALNKWYETTLAGYSACSPKKPRRSTTLIKCLCGDSAVKKDDDCVECKECKRFQHASCVGFDENSPYFCPPCWSKQKLVKSKATLIISPPNIYYQWYEEINKHVEKDTFKQGIFMYDDIKSNFIQPFVLASYDIVICTYARLRAELHHALKNESSRKLRNEERFLKQCSPLAQINWWRLCLDEAQMVEGDSSVIGRMAKLIPAVNRWSVTGTPIQKSVNDMYHLVDFLRIEPFTDRYFWNTLLYFPYTHGNKSALCSTMSEIFWRNSKDDVSDEMFIPGQTVKYHFLKFTAIEQNFYMREHAASSAEFSICLEKSKLDLKTKIDSLDREVLPKILQPLRNLRQACSHFLAVKGNKISAKTGRMTTTDLFKYLYNKAKFECEEELRKHIAALNGMAGLFCIQEEWATAVEFYRTVLQVSEEYKGKVDVDSLQRIHTLTNLAEVLEYHGKDIPPTLRDNSLKDEAKQLEAKYMGKELEGFKSDQKLMTELSKKVKELRSNFSTSTEVWWAHLINLLTIQDAMQEVIDKISAELLANQTESKKSIEAFLSKVSSPKSVELLLNGWISSIKRNRLKVLKRLQYLKKMSPDSLVSEAIDCHLRINSYSEKKKCEICICETDLLDYECCLFAVSRKILKAEYEKALDGAQTKGSWKPHKAERMLRVIFNVAKSKCSSETWALADGRNHLSMLEAKKKEFKQLRVMWMSINHQVQARDEVHMCKMRLRLRFPEEPLPPKPAKLNFKEHSKIETIFIIERHEIEDQRLKLTGEIEVSKSEFRKKYGALMYLDNVGKKENPIPEPCPICKSPLNNEWCVLQCGHCYCIECIRTLLQRNYKHSVSCPVCRELTKSTSLSFVDLSGREENSDITVVGEHSTKIEAVVRTLLALKQKDETVKVLIFSTWPVVLKVLAVALGQNGISFRRMPGHNYQTHIKEFKDPKLNVTALLLPIAWGSKGLNLTEATHVFLIEPIMNPAEELQALGRVHRIGQKKETVVHRFLIKGTIEEKIHSAVSEAKDKWDKKKVTLEDLKNLYDIKQGLVDTDNILNSKNDN